MTNEEAKKILEERELLPCGICVEDRCVDGVYIDADEAFKLAFKALGKQIPKKPIWHVLSKYKNGNVKKGAWKCPNCLRIEYVQRRDALDTHCGFCGQAIEWEGVE